MRKIEFRAWDKKREIMLAVDNLDFGERDLLLRAEHSYIPSSQVEVMQKLSLKDSNGNHIYEGDILQKIAYDGQEYMREGIVVWDCDGFCLRLNKHHDKSELGGMYGLPHPYNKKRPTNSPLVIGNIYENPELVNEVLSSLFV